MGKGNGSEGREAMTLYKGVKKQPRVILIGPPGTGKGTHAASITETYDSPYIGTGDLIRATAKEDSFLGEKLREVIANNAFADDELMCAMVRSQIEKHDSFLLDGFPRTLPQAEALERILKELDKELDAVLVLETDEEALRERIVNRRLCKECGAIYNLKTKPPQGENCDKCGSELMQRSDDTEEKFYERMRDYHEKTEPLVEYYKSRGKLYQVNANRSIPEVWGLIRSVLGRD